MPFHPPAKKFDFEPVVEDEDSVAEREQVRDICTPGKRKSAPQRPSNLAPLYAPPEQKCGDTTASEIAIQKWKVSDGLIRSNVTGEKV